MNPIRRFSAFASLWLDSLFAGTKRPSMVEGNRKQKAQYEREQLLARIRSRPISGRGMPWLKAQVLARIAARNAERKKRKADKRLISFNFRCRKMRRDIKRLRLQHTLLWFQRRTMARSA